jgi:hypothetical protein
MADRSSTVAIVRIGGRFADPLLRVRLGLLSIGRVEAPPIAFAVKGMFQALGIEYSEGFQRFPFVTESTRFLYRSRH